MKTIQILETEDLVFLDKKFYYFFQGDKNFLQSKNSKMPTYFHGDIDEAILIKIHDIFKGTDNSDFELLKAHICNQLEDRRKSLLEAEEKVKHLIKTIGDFKDTLKIVADSETFENAIKELLKNKDTR